MVVNSTASVIPHQYLLPFHKERIKEGYITTEWDDGFQASLDQISLNEYLEWP